MRTVTWMVLASVAIVGCKRPPEAPKGLDDSTNYLMKHFYDDDLTFQAGVQGFVDWYDGEGSDLVNQDATLETLDAYTVGDLSADSIAHLPLEEDIVVDPSDGTTEKRDLTRAKGVVSLAEMQCGWQRAEELLVRKDQHVVFSDDFEGYERTYVTSRKTFEGARGDLDFADVDEPLDPWSKEFDGDATASTLLLTENMVDPTKVITANMDPYAMNLDLRHGVFEVNGEDVGVLAIVTYNIEAAWGSAGNNALLQSYSVEINIERGANKTLRMLAVWSEPKGGGIDPDSPIALNFAVNKASKASTRMSEICAGEIQIPKE